jgi:sugar phosphate isomerase/epimerase
LEKELVLVFDNDEQRLRLSSEVWYHIFNPHVKSYIPIPMIAKAVLDTSRLGIHTITTRPLSIEKAFPAYHSLGARGVTIWRQALEGRKLRQVSRLAQENDLEVISLCRGGFFPQLTASEREAAIQGNLHAVDQAAELGTSLLVIVPGSHPGQSLAESRSQIEAGLAAILPHAAACGVRLGIEPLHPMYAADRSAVVMLSQAIDMCQRLDSSWLGVVLDVYHVWWDPALEAQIRLCGELGRLFAFHICDWRVPTQDLLEDRGLMGEGCIPLRQIRGWVESAGFSGFHEVEIFSRRYWQMDQLEYLEMIRSAYLKVA